jgi:hypothetical protein
LGTVTNTPFFDATFDFSLEREEDAKLLMVRRDRPDFEDDHAPRLAMTAKRARLA